MPAEVLEGGAEVGGGGPVKAQAGDVDGGVSQLGGGGGMEMQLSFRWRKKRKQILPTICEIN